MKPATLPNQPLSVLPTSNPFSGMDTKVSYSEKVDIRMEQDASRYRENQVTDWDDETDMEMNNE